MSGKMYGMFLLLSSCFFGVALLTLPESFEWDAFLALLVMNPWRLLPGIILLWAGGLMTAKSLMIAYHRLHPSSFRGACIVTLLAIGFVLASKGVWLAVVAILLILACLLSELYKKQFLFKSKS
ncbi:hypothetical protein [Aureibacillus halotolerans]|uniref:Uncharacterized protein n=1 Tax=Aureibacillus halotolerans TaxID=1508390 RepID=A0A4R6U9P5_9BACI|nr:hypothetical protein [Aureibacillus halotolerans]TDQ41559.1 hypothetical protein EV213_103137 [Aureibacillus halotolerans]